MAFDGLFAHAMVNELKNTLVGGRVAKISQPYSNEVILTIRANRHNYPLLLSANPNYARIQITKIPYENPQTPTNFTMMLRKYLDGAKIQDIWQLQTDRVIYLSFTRRNELGDQITLLLSIEIMGRHSNVILIDSQENKVLDAIKHVPVQQDRYRTLLPGSTYRTPPKQEKTDPFSEQDFFSELNKQFPNRDVLASELMKAYQGFSKLSGLLLADTLHSAEYKTVNEAYKSFLEKTENPTPVIITHNDKIDFSFFSGQMEVQSTWETLSELLDKFYQEKAQHDRVKQQGADLIKVVKNNLRKNERKLKKQEKELKATENADFYRIKGELLTTYLYKVKRGMTSVTLPNYYNNEQPEKINLSNQLSPSQNAQKYFKRYQKLKNAVKYLGEQIRHTKSEINYLESLASTIELADPSDLPEIKVELQEQGYLKSQKNSPAAKNKRRKSLSKPAEFTSNDGTRISVGKNNKQNDHLTMKIAKKSDFWLHVKNIPGSHVIVHSSSPSDETLTQAAQIAAYFSKGRSSANVAVDYVPVKNIRKPNGAKPGFVIYEGQKTIYVTPEKEEIEKLK
ncbi:Rqc2 family fibronectin-binding protein [Ligilactobacillus acidipiscis]|uniref:Rqc2 homolog RqcH n=1 Tax=Ligilactobacillus acidipiscis TaxID=89059 RepID=A0A0R2K8I7_9LACO|nr:NFACT RNA binding domain-containing protein [Ligilactobacillus acidipiscis]KRN85833.1 fibronectin-binding protein [Ligilactobacillus acidipiscis]SFV40658.1 Fibronectin-binding protein [Ligilactobacillus acidipiscis]